MNYVLNRVVGTGKKAKQRLNVLCSMYTRSTMPWPREHTRSGDWCMRSATRGFQEICESRDEITWMLYMRMHQSGSVVQNREDGETLESNKVIGTSKIQGQPQVRWIPLSLADPDARLQFAIISLEISNPFATLLQFSLARKEIRRVNWGKVACPLSLNLHSQLWHLAPKVC